MAGSCCNAAGSELHLQGHGGSHVCALPASEFCDWAAHQITIGLKLVSVQVTGEAVYTDDLPPTAGLLHAALVKSARPHARILSLDTGLALEVPPGLAPMPGRALGPKAEATTLLTCRVPVAPPEIAYHLLALGHASTFNVSASFCPGCADCYWPEV